MLMNKLDPKINTFSSY